MQLVTTAEMRRIEAAADAAGLSYGEMMRRAGAAVAEAVEARFEAARVLVLAGPGNNGGDGLVAAAELADSGHEVEVYLWRRGADGDPLVEAVLRRGLPLARAEEDADLATLGDRLAAADVVIDALLGTGLGRPLAADLARLLDAVSAEAAGPEGLFVVAVDVPTGLNADDGSLDPHTVPADLTVTFGFPKRGQLRFPGAAAVGELVIDEIGIPRQLAGGGPELAEASELAGWLPARPLDAHKGRFGKALVVAGSEAYTGAAYLAAAAAYRAGCGLVTAALPRGLHPILAGLLPEATFLPLPEAEGRLAEAAAGPLLAAWPAYDAALFGPGLTTGGQTPGFVAALLDGLREAGDPPRLVVDADGLNHLAALPGWPGRLPAPAVLTPHPGEMARLLGGNRAPVDADRLATAAEAAQRWGHVVVLKGAFTIVAAPDGRCSVNPFATPALATAGTGDVLAGLVVGLLAQGLAPFEAAVLAAWLHGRAGQGLSEDLGPRGGLARELLGYLPDAWRALEAAAGGRG